MIDANARSATSPSSRRALGSGTGDQRGDAEAENALRPLGDADLAVEPEAFGPGARVGDQERAQNRHHAGDDRGNPVGDVGRGQQEGADADERGTVPHPIQRGVVERPELGHHGAAAGDLPVERVGHAAEQQQGPAQANVPERVGQGGYQHQASPDGRNGVRPDPGPDQPVHQRVHRGVERLLQRSQELHACLRPLGKAAWKHARTPTQRRGKG